jgi:TusA-related sulfurtransferase
MSREVEYQEWKLNWNRPWKDEFENLDPEEQVDVITDDEETDSFIRQIAHDFELPEGLYELLEEDIKVYLMNY